MPQAIIARGCSIIYDGRQSGAFILTTPPSGDLDARIANFARATDFTWVVDLLAQQRHDILHRWLEAAAVQPFHEGRRERAVADHIPALFDALLDLLRRHAPQGAEPGAALEDPAILAAAQGHAGARFKQGLEAPAVLAEFRLLRQEIGRSLRVHLREGVPGADIVGAELVVHDALDAAALLALAAFSEREAARRRSEEALRQSEEVFRLVIDRVQDYAIFLIDPDGRIASWNAGGERIKGYTTEEALGQPYAMFFTEEDRTGGKPEALMMRARVDGHVEDEGVRVRKDGSRFWADAVLTALYDAEGRLRGYAKVTRDISERRRMEEEQRFLAEASRALASSLEYQVTLRRVAELAVPRIADWCAVDVGEGPAIRGLAVAHVDPAKVQWAEELGRRYPPDPDALVGVGAVIRTGRPELYREFNDEMLQTSARDEEHLRLLRQAGIRSAMIVPLVARGRTLGALTFVTGDSGRRYTEADLALAEDLGRRAALAIDNAHLYADLQRQVEVHVELNAALRETAAAHERALAEVERQRSLLDAVVRQMPAGVVIAEAPSGRLLLGNQQLEQIFRRPFHPSEDVAAYAQYQAFHSDGRVYQAEEWPLARAIQAGEAVSNEEIEILRGDGTRGTILVSSAPIAGPNDVVVAAVATIYDITERRALEERVRQSEMRFRTIIEQFPLSTQVLAPDGTTLMVNGAWEALWGVTLEQIQGYNLLQDPQLVEKGVMPYIERAFAGEPAEIPAIMYEPERTIPEISSVPHRWVRAFIFPVKDDEGSIREVVLIHEDITDRRRVEEEREALLAAEQEARAEAERSKEHLQGLMAMVAHDLRNPVASIIGYGQLLRRGGTSRARVEPALEAIETQAERVDQLLRYLVDAIRIGAGQFDVHPEPMDLSILVSSTAGAMQVTTNRHRILLDVPRRMEGSWDRERLAQVLENLLANAVKYSPDGGEIRVRLWRDNGHAVLRVSDEGVGIRQEDLDQLFQLFSRLDTGQNIEGSGLGLYIARGIIEAHGGRIWAESPGPGRGSTFSFSLPAHQ